MHFHLIFCLDPPYNEIYKNACLPFSAHLSSSQNDKSEIIFFCDKDSSIRKYAQAGHTVIAVSHAKNRSESLMGTPWLVLSPEVLSEDFLEEVCCRRHGVPVTVTETAHCRIRELTMEDYPALLALQAENVQNLDGCFFPSDCENPKEFLQNYIQHQYPFYGYGLYAVLHKNSMEFMGIMGFVSVFSRADIDGELLSASSTAEDDHEPLSLPLTEGNHESFGNSTAEVSYGFLRKWQHQGFAEECLKALLHYGRKTNNYKKFFARIHPSNTSSLALAQKCDITIISHSSFQHQI